MEGGWGQRSLNGYVKYGYVIFFCMCILAVLRYQSCCFFTAHFAPSGYRASTVQYRYDWEWKKPDPACVSTNSTLYLIGVQSSDEDIRRDNKHNSASFLSVLMKNNSHYKSISTKYKRLI